MKSKRFVIKDKELNKYICFGEMDMSKVDNIFDATFFPEKENPKEWVEQYNEFVEKDVAKVIYFEIELTMVEE